MFGRDNMERLIKNGDIILDGTQTRNQAEKKAFMKLENIEELLETYEIDSITTLNRVLCCYWHKREEYERKYNIVNGQDKDTKQRV